MTTDPVYRPKPLEWVKLSDTAYVAKTIMGPITLQHSNYGWDFNFDGGIWLTRAKPTLEAAQESADAWHRDRLLGGLVEVKVT